MWGSYLERLRSATPLVHCITNFVTANDCANILLACGGSPIMAEDAREVAEITGLSDALVINIGTLHAHTVNTMHISGKEANRLGHPVVFDPVGAGASAFRSETAFRLLEEIQFSVIRGNSSEIRALAQGAKTTGGVDAAAADRINEASLHSVISCAGELAGKTGAVVVVTGKLDIITDGSHTCIVRNGHPWLSRITGSGCMLSAMLGAFVAANPGKLHGAVTAAVGAMGLCGELAYEKTQSAGGGTAFYRTALIDAVSLLDSDTFEGGVKIESI